MPTELIVGFDGSCPHFYDGVEKTGQNRFVVRPGHRKEEGVSEEVPGKGSRFYVRLENGGTKTENVSVIADWETEDRTEHHDLGYIRHENDSDWEMIPGCRDGAGIEYRLPLRPGRSELGLYPAYNVGTRDAFVASCESRGFRREIVGESQEERPIWMLSAPSKDKNAANFFIQARDHAYETAGSYCVEGIVDFLLSNLPLSQYIQSKFQVHIIPMTNPDGVFNGMSRLTGERGVNVNSVLVDEPDGAHDALRNSIDRIKPLVIMNIHNWANKFMDGLLANDASIAEKIKSHMPADNEHNKKWFVLTTDDVLKKEGWSEIPDWAESWKTYCKKKFDAVGVTYEFPWFNLNAAEMRRKGERAFVALALASIEERTL